MQRFDSLVTLPIFEDLLRLGGEVVWGDVHKALIVHDRLLVRVPGNGCRFQTLFQLDQLHLEVGLAHAFLDLVGLDSNEVGDGIDAVHWGLVLDSGAGTHAVFNEIIDLADLVFLRGDVALRDPKSSASGPKLMPESVMELVFGEGSPWSSLRDFS